MDCDVMMPGELYAAPSDPSVGLLERAIEGRRVSGLLDHGQLVIPPQWWASEVWLCVVPLARPRGPWPGSGSLTVAAERLRRRSRPLSLTPSPATRPLSHAA